MGIEPMIDTTGTVASPSQPCLDDERGNLVTTAVVMTA
jgi:hypothetical protein